MSDYQDDDQDDVERDIKNIVIRLGINPGGFNFRQGKSILEVGSYVTQPPKIISDNKAVEIEIALDDKKHTKGHLGYWHKYDNGSSLVASMSWDINLDDGLENLTGKALYTEDGKKLYIHSQFELDPDNGLALEVPTVFYNLGWKQRDLGGFGSGYTGEASNETLNIDELQPYEFDDGYVPEEIE